MREKEVGGGMGEFEGVTEEKQSRKRRAWVMQPGGATAAAEGRRAGLHHAPLRDRDKARPPR